MGQKKEPLPKLGTRMARFSLVTATRKPHGGVGEDQPQKRRICGSAKEPYQIATVLYHSSNEKKWASQVVPEPLSRL